jgi:hypothetical protein
LEALGIRRVSRVPPAGAFFIEFVRVAEEGNKEVSPDQLYLRFYLYNDLDHRSKGDLFKLLNISGLVAKHKEGLYSAVQITEFLNQRLSSEGHTPDYLDIECANLNFSLEHELEAKRRLLDPEYTIRELLAYYGLDAA